MADIGVVISNVTTVLTEIMTWVTSSMRSVVNLFVDSTSGDVSILGVFALMGLAVGIALLVVNIVKNFIQFR